MHGGTRVDLGMNDSRKTVFFIIPYLTLNKGQAAAALLLFPSKQICHFFYAEVNPTPHWSFWISLMNRKCLHDCLIAAILTLSKYQEPSDYLLRLIKFSSDLFHHLQYLLEAI